MARSFAIKFYKSRQWKECRQSFIASRIAIDGGKCQRCDEQGYIVDHIVELTEGNITDPSISLNHSNCQYLCLQCHNSKTFGKGGYIRDDLTFDEYGDVIEKV